MSSGVLKIFRDLGFEPLIPHFGTLERALEQLRLPKALATAARGETASPREATARPKRSAGEPAAPAAPSAPETEAEDLATALLGKADIIPLEPLKTAKEDEKVIFIDFKQRTDVREDKDRRIKKMGWDEYGKKLSETDRGPKRRK
jgi:hypothetical protein